MKAKNPNRSARPARQEEILPHELGAHLFALIKRNLLSRQSRHEPTAPRQLTFAF